MRRSRNHGWSSSRACRTRTSSSGFGTSRSKAWRQCVSFEPHARRRMALGPVGKQGRAEGGGVGAARRRGGGAGAQRRGAAVNVGSNGKGLRSAGRRLLDGLGGIRPEAVLADAELTAVLRGLRARLNEL